jgi:hypothetical protein
VPVVFGWIRGGCLSVVGARLGAESRARNEALARHGHEDTFQRQEHLLKLGNSLTRAANGGRTDLLNLALL